MEIPAFCQRCGAIFPSGFAVANVVGLTLQGNLAGPCPRCGGMGEVIQGTFNVIGNAIELVSGPDVTRVRLLHLRDIVERAAAQDRDPLETFREVAREEPKFAPLLDQMRANKVGSLALLLAIITFALSSPGDQVGDAIEWILHLAQQYSQRM